MGRTETVSMDEHEPQATQCSCQANTATPALPQTPGPGRQPPHSTGFAIFPKLHLVCGRLEDGPEKRMKVPGRMEQEASNRDEKQMEVEQGIL